jgi:hypothetical protein
MAGIVVACVLVAMGSVVGAAWLAGAAGEEEVVAPPPVREPDPGSSVPEGVEDDDGPDLGGVEEAPVPASPDDTSADASATEDGEEAGPPRDRLVVHHVGDVNLDPDYLPSLRTLGYEAVWGGIRDTFAEADLVLANLECAPTRGGVGQPKQFVFRCELDALPAMRDAGVSVVSLANNHSGDYGIQAMVEGVDNVEAAGIVAVGVGADEAEAYTSRVIEVAGWRIAILGFGGVVPDPSWTARGTLSGQATGYDPARMAEAVALAREDADLVIATVHWGAEGALEPRPEDVVKAEAMIAAGADVVFGHHAHRLQPLEEVDGAPVFWNLGNFVWPRLSQAGATTAVAEWIVEPDGTVTSCLLPVEIDERGVPAPTGAPRECL